MDYYPLEVAKVDRITQDAIKVTFNLSESQRDHFKFIPGQYLSFRQTVNGEDVRRTYSICSSKFDDELSIGIKKVPGGRFSGWANEELKAGDTIETLPPTGRFCLGGNSTEGNHYLMFAAGSGITPILSILKSTLMEDKTANITLVYGNRSINSIMFREELEALKNHYMGRLNLIQILSGGGQDIDLFSGRVDSEKCKALFSNWINLSKVDQVLICGPEPMMETISHSLEAHGFPKEQIRYELFGAQGSRQDNVAQQKAELESQDLCEVTVQLDGVSHQFSMAKAGGCFLKTAREHNIDVPSSCEAGVCATCRARVIEGEAVMAANHVLEDYEIARGAILTCQMEVLSDKIKISYDE